MHREHWRALSLLILCNAAFAGMTRFTDFQKSLDIAPNVLVARLERFVETGLMAASGGSQGHQTYHLTKKGLDFKPVIIAFTEWGDRWALQESGKPALAVVFPIPHSYSPSHLIPTHSYVDIARLRHQPSRARSSLEPFLIFRVSF